MHRKWLLLALIISCSCHSKPLPAMHDRLPADISKVMPQDDPYPPIMHSLEYEKPRPLWFSTRGAEDSPFIPAGTDELYFFFTPDVRVPPERQILDQVTGIYSVRITENRQPQRIMLQKKGKLALDGCPFVLGSMMLFCSAREGFTGMQWFRAEHSDSWQGWEPADLPAGVGELHIRGSFLYHHSAQDGGVGGLDIWRLSKSGREWKDPVNVHAVNTPADESLPFISPDGSELWFTRTQNGTPAVFVSRRSGEAWQEPALVVSRFAGEPTLDGYGNLYFVHHYYREGQMLEADIYVACRKGNSFCPSTTPLAS